MFSGHGVVAKNKSRYLMHFNIKNSIALRLVIIAIFAISSLLVVKGVVDYFSQKAEIMENTEKIIDRASTRLQLNLPSPLWNYNNDIIENIVKSELDAPDVFSIKVTNADKEIAYQGASSEGSNGDTITVKLVFIEDDTENDVGQVSLVANQELIEEKLAALLGKIIFDVIFVDVLLIVLLSILLKLIVTQPLNTVITALTDIAQGDGDLTQRLSEKRQDEIGQLSHQFNIFVEKIQTVVSSISDSTQRLYSATGSIKSQTEEADGYLLSQQDETQTMATAITEMAAVAQMISENVRNTSESSIAAQEKANQINNIVSESITSVNTLSGHLSNAEDVVSNLEVNVSGIVSMVDIIKGVADQTNLLALNAAIEAARAGEQGRGFAVVADEVRALASRTQESTEEINRVIEQLQQGSATTVKVFKESMILAKDTVEITQKTSAIVIEIVDANAVISDMSMQILTSVEEQRDVSSSLDVNVNGMVNTVNDTGKVMNSINEQVRSMDNLSQELTTLVQQFKV